MELIWCFIFVLLGKQGGREAWGLVPNNLLAQRSIFAQPPLGEVEPCSLSPCPHLSPPACHSSGALSQHSVAMAEANPVSQLPDTAPQTGQSRKGPQRVRECLKSALY